MACFTRSAIFVKAVLGVGREFRGTGHKSLEMVKKYRQQARQKQLSKMAQLRRNSTKTEKEQ